MTFKDDVRSKTGSFLTKSQEIFEKIFAQATREFKIKRKPKAAAQKPAPVPSREAPRTRGKSPEVSTRSEKTVPTYKASEKVKASPKPKPIAERTTRKGSGLLRACLLFILLLVVAGFAANYFALIDFAVIADFVGLAPKPVVQAPIPRKEPAKLPEKTFIPQKPPQTEEKAPTASTALTTPTPPAASKEEKLVELETPTTVAPLKEEKTRVEEKSLPAPATDQPKPSEVAAKQESQPLPAQTELLEKPSIPTVSPLKQSAPQYPYSVYLGSFKAPEAVKKAISDYQEKGLAAYWVRVDLGDKGVWYRFFTGYFRTKEDADKYIRDRSLQGASPGITKYANLIGTYASEKEIDDQKRALMSAGFCPYVIKAPDGKSLIYSGAFDRKEYAEKERNDLALKGIRSEVVER
jgi:hypothetical protein